MGVDDSMGGNWGTDAQRRHFLISQDSIYTPQGKQHLIEQDSFLRDSFAASVWHGQYVDLLDELYALFDNVSVLIDSQNKESARYVLGKIDDLTKRILLGFTASQDELSPKRLFEMYTRGYRTQLQQIL